MKARFYCVMILVLYAQFASAQRFGIKGGMNFANVDISSSGVSISPTSITGFHVGPIIEFNLDQNVFFNTGVLYSLKGFKLASEGEELSEKLNYIEVPFNFAYKFLSNGKADFFIQAGPYLGYAASGKTKLNDVSVDIDFDEEGLKRMDYGLGFGAGLEFGAVVASLNYQLGAANLNDDSSADVKMKNKVFQISLAYMFGK